MRRTIRRLLTGAVVAALLTGGTTLPASAAPPSEREMSTTSFTSPLVFQNPAGGYIAYSSGPEQGGITRFRDFRATTHATYAQAAGTAVSVVLPDPGAGHAEVKLPGGECITTLDGAGPGRTLTASKGYCNSYGYTWSVTNDGRVVSTLDSTGMGPTQAANSAYWPFTGLRPFITGGGYALGGSRFEVAPLVVRVDRVDHIARTAVLSGTATKNAEVRAQGRTTTANATTGAWSLDVRDLSVGTNDVPVTQRVSGVDQGTETARIEIIEGGTLVPAPTSRVDLARGGATEVPFIVENRAARTGMTGTVELTAPEGSTFADGQTTVQAESNRAGEGSAWTPLPRLDLTGGSLGDDGRTMTFDLASGSGALAAGEYYRYVLSVDTPASSAPRESSMAYVYRGDSSAGDYRAAGATATRVAGAATIDTTATGTVPGGTTDWARSDVRLSEARGPMTLTAPAGSSFADVETRRTADDAQQSNYRVTYSADRRTATIDGPSDGSDAFWGSDHQYVAFRLLVGDDARPGTPLTGGAVVVRPTAGGTPLAEGSFEIDVDATSLTARPGDSTPLTRGAGTPVGFGATATTELTRVEGRFELTAPEGTTFAPGQATIQGQYLHPGEQWVGGSRALDLTGGELSSDGRTYRYDYAATTSTFRLLEGTRLRWAIAVDTPADAAGGPGVLGFSAEGTTSGSDFRFGGSTPVVVDESTPTLTAEVTVSDDVTRPAVIGGVGDENGVVTVHEGDTELGRTTVIDGRWSLDVPVSVGPGRHTFTVTQTVDDRPIGSAEADVDLGSAVEWSSPRTARSRPDASWCAAPGRPGPRSPSRRANAPPARPWPQTAPGRRGSRSVRATPSSPSRRRSTRAATSSRPTRRRSCRTPRRSSVTSSSPSRRRTSTRLWTTPRSAARPRRTRPWRSDPSGAS
jgi:hypothetical protein